MIKLKDLFQINNGNGFYLKNMDIGGDINYISMSGNNNGISEKVHMVEDIKPFKSGLITVAMQGTVLSTFVQPNDFYTSLHVAVLEPKVKMTDKEKIFYCMCIEANKFRYSYGRKANRTLKDLLVPHLDNIPSWVYEANIPDYSNIHLPYLEEKTPELKVEDWKEFRLDELFDIKYGTFISTKSKEGEEGLTPYITTTANNNGIGRHIKRKPDYPANSLTIATDGTIGEVFYQETPYCASNITGVLIPKFELNPYIAMFLITILKQERFRYSYGRKWSIQKVRETRIRLPEKEGKPDWKFMEEYVKSLKWSREV